MCGTRLLVCVRCAVVIAIAILTVSAFSQDVGKYSGPGSCAASNCHGSVTVRTTTRVQQNEYSIWASQDKHQQAYRVLSNPTSIRMGKILKLSTPPNQSEKCRACHTLDVPPNLRAQTFQSDEGVSCENCHGPAVGWLGKHTTKDWNRDQSIALGEYETRDLMARSERCLTCHVGTAKKNVDHEMYAAGHPVILIFELDLFSSQMPRHWKYSIDGDPWEAMKEWSIGQAVELREVLNRLNRGASAKSWPEYSELDCYACHHSLTAPQNSWRQARGYAGRDPGAPSWNLSRYVVFRHLADQINPQRGKELRDQIAKVEALVGSRADREQIAAAAAQAASVADQIAKDLRQQPYNRDLSARVMLSIAEDGTPISDQGEFCAQAAYMSLYTISRAYLKNEKPANAADLRAAIDHLFDLVQSPGTYSAPTFAAQMQKVKALLPGVKQTALLDPPKSRP